VRLRIAFSKTEAMRFTSHLDLYRAWVRTLRRARLPLAYSQGFKPHPKINIAAALPLGFTSQGDLVDIWLADTLSNEEIHKRLAKALPPGIIVENVTEIENEEPSLQSRLEAAKYSAVLNSPVQALEDKIEALLAASHLQRKRNDKEYDLRPLIVGLKYTGMSAINKQTLEMILKARPSETGRPEEVIEALEGDPHQASIHRYELIFTHT
jgi:radical SAM-linked protein